MLSKEICYKCWLTQTVLSLDSATKLFERRWAAKLIWCKYSPKKKHEFTFCRGGESGNYYADDLAPGKCPYALEHTVNV